MRRLLAAACSALVLAGALGACGDDDDGGDDEGSTDETSEDTGDDSTSDTTGPGVDTTALVNTVVLTEADVPDGWTQSEISYLTATGALLEQAGDTEGCDAYEATAGLIESQDLARIGSSFDGPGDDWFGSATVLFPDEAAASAYMEGLADDQYFTCLGALLAANSADPSGEATAGDGPEVAAGDASVSKTFELPGGGQTTVVWIQVGRGVITFAINSADDVDLSGVYQTAAERLESALAGAD
jgi:hypothetical protein